MAYGLWPMMRRVAVAGATHALWCLSLARDRYVSLRGLIAVLCVNAQSDTAWPAVKSEGEAPRRTGAAAMAAWTCTCVLALAGVASAGRVRQANSGVPVQGLRGTRSPVKFSPDDDQAVMTAFLVELGFTQYATADFVSRLDEELACDSIEDLATLHDDEEYRALGISNEDAEKIGTAAQVELVKRFLLTIPHENGTMTGYYAKFTQ
eukprot:3964834-Prymnesium_polylepis.1